MIACENPKINPKVNSLEKSSTVCANWTQLLATQSIDEPLR